MEPALGGSLIVNDLRWINKVVNAFAGAFSSGLRIKYPHEFGIANQGKGDFRYDGGQSFGRFLTDTVSYHH